MSPSCYLKSPPQQSYSFHAQNDKTQYYDRREMLTKNFYLIELTVQVHEEPQWNCLIHMHYHSYMLAIFT